MGQPGVAHQLVKFVTWVSGKEDNLCPGGQGPFNPAGGAGAVAFNDDFPASDIKEDWKIIHW